MKNHKNILTIVSHSLAELDILFPLFLEINEKNKKNIKIIFTVEKIYKQYLKNEFYLFCTNSIGIEVSFCKMSSKFDAKLQFVDNFFLKFYYKILKAFYIIRFILKNLNIFKYDCFLHETSNQINSTIIVRLISKYFNKKLFIYHHGHSLNQISYKSTKVKTNEKDIFLCFSNLNVQWAKSLGFKNIVVIGFPAFYKNWNKFLNNYLSKNKKNQLSEPNVIIFSRKPNHDYYMDIDKYKSLIISSYRSIRKYMPNIKIFIKLHPREVGYSEIILNEIFKKNKFKNIAITSEDTNILIKESLFTISLWSSTILLSLAQNKPSIEYYLEAKKFRLAEPLGSLYKYHGIDSANNDKELDDFIHKVKNNKYTLPKIVNKFILEKNLIF